PQDEAPVSAGIETPLADSAGHVVGPRRADPARAADGDGSVAGVVARGDDPGAVVHCGGVIPVRDGRQRLAGELGERRGLVPADPRDRMVLLPGGVLAGFPRGWSGPTGPAGPPGRRLLPRDDATIHHEGRSEER